MRELCGDFWLRLGESSFSEVFALALIRVDIILSRTFSARLLSFRRLVSAPVGVASLYLFYLAYLSLIFPLEYSTTYKPLFQDEIDFLVRIELGDVLPSLFYASFFTLLVFTLSLSLTIFFVSRAVSAERGGRRISFLLFDIFSLGLLWYLLRAFAGIWLIFVIFRDPQQQSIANYSLAPALVFSIVPSGMYFCVVTFHIFLKAFDWALRPSTMLVLIRLQESPKGVLTNLSIAVGAVAKIMQQALKVWA